MKCNGYSAISLFTRSSYFSRKYNLVLYIGKDYSDGYERVLVSNNKTGNVEENR